MNNNNNNNQFGVVPALEMPMRPALTLHDHYAYTDLVEAYLDCRRRKRNKRSAVAFESRFERNLEILRDEVNSGRYAIGRSNVFVVTHPKPREVWAAGFRDRIVHHLVFRDIAPWYESGFIEDSFSCIKGRGTLAARLRAERFARRATENWSRPAWALQVDIANFFVSIDRPVLWDVLRTDIGETSLTARLVRQIVFHDPTAAAVNTTPQLSSLVPPHKSLWHCRPGCGLPIGNLTSQFFSNVYLDALDKFAKHVLGVRHYVRYVDDILIFSRDRARLFAWRDALDEWLRDNRAMHLHPAKSRVVSADAGLNFVGGVILPWRTYPRRMTVDAARRAFLTVAGHPLSAGALESATSYLGTMRAGMASFGLRRALCRSVAPFLSADSGMTKIYN